MQEVAQQGHLLQLDSNGEQTLYRFVRIYAENYYPYSFYSYMVQKQVYAKYATHYDESAQQILSSTSQRYPNFRLVCIGQGKEDRDNPTQYMFCTLFDQKQHSCKHPQIEHQLKSQFQLNRVQDVSEAQSSYICHNWYWSVESTPITQQLPNDIRALFLLCTKDVAQLQGKYFTLPVPKESTELQDQNQELGLMQCSQKLDELYEHMESIDYLNESTETELLNCILYLQKGSFNARNAEQINKVQKQISAICDRYSKIDLEGLMADIQLDQMEDSSEEHNHEKEECHRESETGSLNLPIQKKCKVTD